MKAEGGRQNSAKLRAGGSGADCSLKGRLKRSYCSEEILLNAGLHFLMFWKIFCT